MYNVKNEDSKSKGKFYIEIDNTIMAEVTYSKGGKEFIIIDHTEIDASLRGTGAGKLLIEAAVQWARDNNLKIIPLCPYANSVFQRYENLRDVLKS